jgi:D-serine deaminase-like pyridoxal phosphate-dependent protein
MAMSRDRGTASHPVDQKYGLVTSAQGDQFEDLLVTDANQEHGIISQRDCAKTLDYGLFPLAGLVRVLPNHACATAAQFDRFYLVDGNKVVDELPSISGW